jgi:hypothetical protein
MARAEIETRKSGIGAWLPRVIAIGGGAGFLAAGLWAMVDPHSFFEALARFEPYNQHFLQDIGAFQVGLGVVLLIAGLSPGADGLTVALLGVGVAAALHFAPERDIPVFAAMAVALLVAGAWRWSQVRGDTR